MRNEQNENEGKKASGLMNLAAAFAIGLLLVTSAGFVLYVNSKPIFTWLEVPMYMISPSDEYVPKTSFDFELAPYDGDMTCEGLDETALPGLRPDGKSEPWTQCLATFGLNDRLSDELNQNDVDVARRSGERSATYEKGGAIEFDAGDEYARATATILIEPDNFKKAGRYRYLLTMKVAKTTYAPEAYVEAWDARRVVDVIVKKAVLGDLRVSKTEMRVYDEANDRVLGVTDGFTVEYVVRKQEARPDGSASAAPTAGNDGLAAPDAKEEDGSGGGSEAQAEGFPNGSPDEPAEPGTRDGDAGQTPDNVVAV